MARRKRKTKNDFSLWFGEVVKIIWVGPLYCEEIREKELAKEPDMVFNSYGEVVNDGVKSITIAGTIGHEKQDRLMREVVRIPWSLIKSIVLLNEGQEVQL